MNKQKKSKKHSYLLLELLVALFLLSLFLTPMLSSPFAYVKKQKHDIQSLYLQLEEEKLLIFMEEQLRTGQIPWDVIVKSETSPQKVGEKTFTLPGDKKPYQARLFITQTRLQSKESETFGTCKTVVKIYQKPMKKPKKNPGTATIFVLKKHQGAALDL